MNTLQSRIVRTAKGKAERRERAESAFYAYAALLLHPRDCRVSDLSIQELRTAAAVKWGHLTTAN